MTTASTVPHDLRETTKDAREGAREIKDAAAGASRDIQDDLQALREDFGRLAEQIGQILSDRGGAAWQRARTGVDGVMSDAQDKSREAVDAMRGVSDNFVAAIDDSLKNRPYTTLAIIGGIGFLLGAMWRR